jgi:hypothetical protein
MRSARFRILLLAVAGILSVGEWAHAQLLKVERHGDYLHVFAPQFHFITGRALNKLHDGSAVTYVITLSTVPEHAEKAAFILQERFTVSYDLWEEKFSVIQTGRNGRAISRLTAAMAEAWCLENMSVPVRMVPEQQLFMIKLECSIDERGAENDGKGDSGLTLEGLIEVFSRKQDERPLHWESTTGFVRLSDLKNNKHAR